MPFGMKNTRIVWLPTVKICLFVLTGFTNVTDRRTDGQTRHDGIGRAFIASRGKNYRSKDRARSYVASAAACPPFVVNVFRTSVDNTVDLYAAKPDIPV